MEIVTFVLQIILLIWFFGCIRSYRIGGRLLVEGMGIKSAEFVMFCLYALGIVLSAAVPRIGIPYILTVLILWFVIQFFCHWYYTIFGASEKKLRGYNSCFRDTIRIIPASDRRLIPDLYHMILHLLILSNIAFAVLRLA